MSVVFRPSSRVLLVLLAAYVLTRAALGAAVNPPLNGPDEGGHVEYVSSFVASAGRRVTGVEHRQPPTFYAIAAVPWLLTRGAPEDTRLLTLRLLSAAAGAVTACAAWLVARRVWPGRALLAAAVAALATLAPGHLFLLSSVGNDPLAEALASLAVLAALRCTQGRACGDPSPSPALPETGEGRAAVVRGTMTPLPRTGSPSPHHPLARVPGEGAGGVRAPRPKAWDRPAVAIVPWLAAGVAAVATKLTALPVVLATAMVVLAPRWRALWARRWARVVVPAAALAGAAAYAWLLTKPPSSSYLASLAHFWWLALLRAPVAYVRAGGLAESFRTFWYAYDYAVTWPRPLEAALAGAALAVSLLALAGLRRTWRTVPPGIWAVALVQVALVVARFGFGDTLNVAMGGAAQAKAFFPASVPLAVLFVAGLSGLSGVARVVGPVRGADGARGGAAAPPPAAGRRAWASDRLLALGVFLWLLAMDGASLAVTLWHHFRWWQVTS